MTVSSRSAGPVVRPVAGPTAVLVAHDGGPRNGQVAVVPGHLARVNLVYDGPRWWGVYRRSDPLRVVATEQGDAEVWVVWG